MDLIQIDKEKCKLCLSCIRICPVKAIKTGEDDFPQVIQERCIACGSCMATCSPEAIHYRSSIAQVNALLSSEHAVCAIVDPSISGEFPDVADYRKFVEMIRKLGFAYVNEASFGVDMVAREYKNLFDNEFKGKYYVAANCPVVVSYIEKYYPDLVDNLAPIVSPMIAAAMMVRKKYGQQIKVVFIGPCIAAKQDAVRYREKHGEVNAVLTFQELRKLFKSHKIAERSLEYSDFDPPYGYKGSLYPITNGIIQAAEIDEMLLSSHVITSEGRAGMLQSVQDFDRFNERINCHFNIFYDEGCLMGPGTSPDGDKTLRRAMVIQFANKRLRSFNYEHWENELRNYLSLDMSRSFQRDDQRLPPIEKNLVDDVMADLGREQDNMYCQACGYDSCRDFAESVVRGFADKESCFRYAATMTKDYMKDYKLVKEQFIRSKKNNADLEKKITQGKKELERSQSVIDSVLEELPFSLVILNSNLKIRNSSRAFIEMLGEDAREINEVIPGLKGADIAKLVSYNFVNLFRHVLDNKESVYNRSLPLGERKTLVSVFPVKDHDDVCVLFRDAHLSEVSTEEIKQRVTEVVDKNIEMVQKIGFILGEEASGVEQLLKRIIDLFDKEQ